MRWQEGWLDISHMGDMTVTGAVVAKGGLVPGGYFGSGKRLVLVTRAGSVSSPKAAVSCVYMREIKGRWRKIASYCH